MVTAHDWPSQHRAGDIEQKAAEWVARSDLQGSESTDHWTQLAAWLAENPRHRAAFLRISAAYRRADELRRLAPLTDEVDPDLLDPARWQDTPPLAQAGGSTQAEAPLAAVVAPIIGLPPVIPFRMSTPTSRWARLMTGASSLVSSRIAASLAAIAIVGLVGFGSWYAYSRSGMETYATKTGEFRRVALPDGSTVALNTNSQVQVRYTATAREVQLVRGEALFAVAKNPARPFDVEARDTTVRAVGTEFSVRLHDEARVGVVVSEGRVAINPPATETFGAGSVALVKGGRIEAMIVTTDDITSRLSWTTGRLSFRGATLGEVVDEFNRYNSRKLAVTDPELAKLSIGGTFNATDPDGFASALSRTTNVRPTLVSRAFGGDVIRLERAAP